MKKIWSAVAVAAILTSSCMLSAAEDMKADKLVDAGGSIVSYDIKTAEGEDLIVTADYASARPDPEIENLDIAPRVAMKDGSKAFRVITTAGPSIEIQFVYVGGERTAIKISSEPPNPSSDTEDTKVLSVKSAGGHTINFTFVWQGKDLKEVGIEPLVNPFSA